MKYLRTADLRMRPELVGRRAVYAPPPRTARIAHIVAPLVEGKRPAGYCRIHVTHVLEEGELTELRACPACVKTLARLAAAQPETVEGEGLAA